MSVFSGSEGIKQFLEVLDGWLSESVDVYLLGGSAMTIRNLKDQTEDIDLALGAVSEFEHVYRTLNEQSFEVTDEPTESFDSVGKTVELYNSDSGFRVDLFDRQVVGKVWVTERMRKRSEAFWSGSHVTAFVLSDEDMFLLKAVSGGDLGSGRRRDLEDMRKYAQRGLEYDSIIEEIDKQRPFNDGSTEASRFGVVLTHYLLSRGREFAFWLTKRIHESRISSCYGVRNRVCRSGVCG